MKKLIALMGIVTSQCYGVAYADRIKNFDENQISAANAVLLAPSVGSGTIL